MVLDELVGGKRGAVRIGVSDEAVVVANDGRHVEDRDGRPVGRFYKGSKMFWGSKDFVGEAVHGWVGRVVRMGVWWSVAVEDIGGVQLRNSGPTDNGLAARRYTA